MSARKIIPVGTPFERLTVTGDGGRVEYGTQGVRVSMSQCVCACGNEVTVSNASLRRGGTKSCGCLNREATIARNIARATHGQSRHGSATTEYKTWRNIIARTTNTDISDWQNYGGRGITVCERWLESFENFYADMGPKPSPSYSIDRINNDGHYSPENCRWTTKIEQSNNQRNSVRFTFYGLDKTVAEWYKITLVPRAAIHKRLHRGWSTRFAFWAPSGSTLAELQVRYPHHNSFGLGSMDSI